MTARILVTGSTGKTGSALVRQLRAAGSHVLAATRTPKSPGDVAFDWREPSTFDAALDRVGAVYLVAPTDAHEPLAPMLGLLERVKSRRVVLLSASSLPLGGPMMGAVHQWLADHASDFGVLRPTWFMQNFTTQHLRGILDDGAIYSATGDGRVSFIDAEDIAAVAGAMLLAPDTLAGDAPILTGPVALSYDDVANEIADASGRAVRHVRLNGTELAARYLGYGLNADYASTLAGLDAAVAAGSEDRVTDDVKRWTGREPRNFREFLAANAEVFAGG